jgi:hypothetical protein
MCRNIKVVNIWLFYIAILSRKVQPMSEQEQMQVFLLLWLSYIFYRLYKTKNASVENNISCCDWFYYFLRVYLNKI